AEGVSDQRTDQFLKKYLTKDLPQNEELSEPLRNALASQIHLNEAMMMIRPTGGGMMAFTFGEREDPNAIKRHFQASVRAYPANRLAYEEHVEWIESKLDNDRLTKPRRKPLESQLAEVMKKWSKALPDDVKPRLWLVDHLLENEETEEAKPHVDWLAAARQDDPRVRATPWKWQLLQAMRLSRRQAWLAEVPSRLEEAELQWPTWLSRQWLPYLHAAWTLRCGKTNEFEQQRQQICIESGIVKDSLADACMMLGAAQRMRVSSADLKPLRAPVDAAVKNISKLPYDELLLAAGFFWDLQENATNDLTFTYGSEMLRISSIGNLGIGTTNPNQRLHIEGGDVLIGPSSVVHDATANADLFVQGNLVVDGKIVHAGGAGAFDTLAIATETVTTGELFKVGAGTLTVLSNGSVGIGTTGPGALLEVREQRTDTQALLRLRSDEAIARIEIWADQDATGDTTADAVVGFAQGSTWEWYMGVDASDADKLKFGYNTATVGINTAMTIDQSGNVGIGTASPAAKLSIANGANDPLNYGQALQITNLSGNRQQIAFIRDGFNVVSVGYNGASNVWGFGAGNTTDASFSPSFLSIDASNGNVGIGTTGPAEMLHMFKSGADTKMIIEGTGTQFDQSLEFRDAGGGWFVGQRWQTTANNFGIGTSNAKDELVITSAG
ncbi:MAG: hypothetical protein IH899_22430, partial [Planctomycetes bacterium]|nr:hypothetical protein [Planctomycetota bacterium]